jgi:ATP-binding cassette subfamily B protein
VAARRPRPRVLPRRAVRPLDEPTAALDARAESELFERLRELLAGRSVVLVSHRFSSVRSADRICVLHEGRVVEHGTHDELLALGGLYTDLFTLQAAAYAEAAVDSSA